MRHTEIGCLQYHVMICGTTMLFPLSFLEAASTSALRVFRIDPALYSDRKVFPELLKVA